MKKLSEILNEHKVKLHICDIEFADDIYEKLVGVDSPPHGQLRLAGNSDPRYDDSGNEGGITKRLIYKTFESIDDKIIEYIWNNKDIKFGKGSNSDSFGIVVDDKYEKSWFILFNIYGYNSNDETYKIWVYNGHRHPRPTHIKNVRYGIYIDKSEYIKTKENIDSKKWPERK